MFGYVMPNKPELLVREWQEYRAMYCGLCKELKREYGFRARLLLNYDLVVLALTADGLSGCAAQVCAERCIANPLSKRPVCASTDGLALAADALILTAYYKLADDVADERFFKKLAARAATALFSKAHKKAAQRCPQMDAVLAAQTKAQSALEAANTSSPDAAADPTAQMTAALFSEAGDTPAKKRALTRMGLMLGKIIYYLDAAEDFDSDEKQGAYNVFLRMGLSREQAHEQARLLCRMAAGELSLAYNLLDFTQHKGLLDNIIFAGIPQSILCAGMPRNKRTQEGSSYGRI